MGHDVVSHFVLCTVHFLGEMLTQDQDTVQSVPCTVLSLKNILIALEESLRIK